MKRKIHIIRHGITEGNLRQQFYGWIDYPLLPEGVAQLEELRETGIHPRPEHPLFFTSDLVRTEQTMEVLYGPQPHIRIPELRELHFGVYEDKTHAELEGTEEFRIWRESHGEVAIAEGMETMTEFRTRVLKGWKILLDRLAEEPPETEAILVIHAGAINEIMSAAVGDPEACGRGRYGWSPATGRGFTLVLEDGVVKDYQEI